MSKKFLGLGLAAALLLVGAGCRSNGAPEVRVPEASKPYNTAPITNEANKTTPPTATAPARKRLSPGITVPAVSPTASAEATLPYSQAVATYGRKAYFQFVDCHAIPGSLTIKKGDKLMLDNRDTTKHRVTVGSKVYTLGSYAYIVITADIAGQHTITCDGGGVGAVNVQL